MSSRIRSPTEMLFTELTLRLVVPAGAGADRRARVPGRPPAGTGAPPRAGPEPIISFWPTVKPPVPATGTLVEPAGTVITGPSGSGCQSVVLPLAAVPTPAIVRVSPSTSIVSPALMPVVLRTLMVLSPALAGAASPELERPSSQKRLLPSVVPAGTLIVEKIACCAGCSVSVQPERSTGLAPAL